MTPEELDALMPTRVPLAKSPLHLGDKIDQGLVKIIEIWEGDRHDISLDGGESFEPTFYPVTKEKQ